MLKRKNLISGVLILALVLILSVSALASSFSANYSIPTGSSASWSGKSDHLWKFTSTNEATFKTTISNTSDRSINSALWMVKVLAPDTKIVSYALSGKNGDYKTATFTPQTSNSYYAVITPVDTSGVNGTVSAYN